MISQKNKFILAITMGDPAGIGPEICAKLFADGLCPAPAIVLGDAAILARTASELGLSLPVRRIAGPEDAGFESNAVDVIDLSELPDDMAIGQVQAACGRAAFNYIRHGIDLALAGQVAGIVTAPIHKEALAAAGIPYPGHTEMLADLGGAGEYSMMLVNDELRVVLVSIHVPLREAIGALTAESVLRAIRLASTGCRELGIGSPRIAVAGLNPHAGEGGLFGREDIEIIAPAVELAVREGLDVSGPFAGDTVFMRARRGEFDVVVAQYHDQGLIPIKYHGIEQGVNITVGLPFIRTSVDHGTAFDIAGKGVADPSSLRAALEMASKMAEHRSGGI